MCSSNVGRRQALSHFYIGPRAQGSALSQPITHTHLVRDLVGTDDDVGVTGPCECLYTGGGGGEEGS